MDAGGPRYFISYARTDSNFAFQLAEDLQSAGVDIWLDREEIPPDGWSDAIQEAIDASQGMIVVLSPDWVDSEGTQNEVTHARKNEKRIIPVLYRSVEIPSFLKNVQSIDLTTDYEKRFTDLLEAIRIEQPAETPQQKDIDDEVVDEDDAPEETTKEDEPDRPVIPTVVAGITRQGQTRIQVAQVERAWRLSVDALVLPAAASLDRIGGSFVGAMMDDLGKDTAEKLDNFLQSNFPKGLAYDKPAALALPEELGKQILPFPPIEPVKLVIATVRGAKGEADLNHVKPMMRSLVTLAAEEGIQRMVLPLLGTGAAKADPVAVAQRMLEGLTEVRDFGSVRSITLAVLEPEVVERARRQFNRLTNNLAQPVSNDEPAKEDLLGIEKEVHALAEMLLLQKVKPPLAVGILGGWGSGKSTVMRLMQGKMNEIRARPLEKGWEDDAPYVGHVYQIIFNAWTYAKSNLWASLMQQVFFDLNRQLSREESLQQDDFSLLEGGPLWKILRDQKKKQRAALREIEKNLARLKADHEDAQAARQNSVAHHVARDAVKDKVKAVLKGLYTGSVKDFFEAKGAPDKKKVDEVFEELKSQKMTVEKVWKTMGSSRPRRIGLVVCAVIAFASPFLIGWLTNQDVYKQSIAWLASVSGVFLPLIAIMAQIARTYRRSVDAIVEEYQRSVEKDPMDERLAQRQADDEKDVLAILADETLEAKDKEKAIKDLADAGNLAAYEHQVKLLEARAKEKSREVGSTATYASLIDFVQARQDEAFYDKRLGLMHQVKADLDELTSGLTLPNEDEQKAWTEEEVTETIAIIRKLFPRGEPRVILYIDDLDRCPPNRVVQVMEAVQLLLNTRLFIVVLGLDTRYVTRALEKEYKEILQREGDPSGLDYIEKILQIPYRVRPIEPDSLANFLEKQMDVVGSGGTGSGRGPDGGGSGSGSGDGNQKTDDTQLGDSDRKPRDTGSGDGKQKTDDGKQKTDGTGSGDGDEKNGEGGTGSSPEPAKALPPEIVRFQPEDRLDLTACCRQINLTPRSIKRLVNVLKLVKIFWFRKQEGDASRPVKQTVIGLLALSAAYPEIMREAFVQLDGLYREPDKAKLKIIDFLSNFSLPGNTWRFNRFHADVKTLRRVPVDADAKPLAFCDTTLAELTVSTFNLVRSFSFVGDPSYPTDRQAEEPPATEDTPKDPKK